MFTTGLGGADGPDEVDGLADEDVLAILEAATPCNSVLVADVVPGFLTNSPLLTSDLGTARLASTYQRVNRL